MKQTLIRLLASAALVSGIGAAAAFAQPGPGGPRGEGREAIDFTAIDANADGRVDRAELTGRAVERIAVFDLNGDGQLDRAELIAIFPARQGLHDIFAPNPAERMADRILALHGATAQGTVPVAAMAESRVNRVFAAFDEDGDGVLTLEEVQRPDRGGRDGGRDGGREHGHKGPRG